MRPPFFTVTTTGLYLNDLMSIVAEPTAGPAAGFGAAAEVEGGGLVAPALPLSSEDELPHPATTKATTKASAAGRGRGLMPLLRRSAWAGSVGAGGLARA